jgi:hypothetical protein
MEYQPEVASLRRSRNAGTTYAAYTNTAQSDPLINPLRIALWTRATFRIVGRSRGETAPWQRAVQRHRYLPERHASVHKCTNISGLGNPAARANNNGQSAHLDEDIHGRLNRYFDTSVFRQPAAFTLANVGTRLNDLQRALNAQSRPLLVLRNSSRANDRVYNSEPNG